MAPLRMRAAHVPSVHRVVVTAGQNQTIADHLTGDDHAVRGLLDLPGQLGHVGGGLLDGLPVLMRLPGPALGLAGGR